MDRSERVILTNMCMVCDGAGNVLVQDRLDPDWPGVAFPGGHVEPGESFTAAVIREVREETGLTIEAPRLCGLKQFPLEDGGRYVVLLYRADRFSGELISSREGEVFWLERSRLDAMELPASFAQTLQIFEDDGLGEHYIHWEGGEIKRDVL